MAIKVRKASIMAKNSSKTFLQAREAFFREKKGEGLKDSTLATYRIHIDYFFNSLSDCGDLPVNLFDKDDYIFFLNFIKYDESKNERTRQSYCRSIKAFLNWLMDNDYIEHSFKIAIPKAQKNVKQTYTDEEIKVLLKDPRPDACSVSTYQTWVFINFCLATGLRLSSILSIQCGDYEPSELTVVIRHTKNGEPKLCHLNSNMCNILNEYISRFELNKYDYLFFVADGKKMSSRAMEDNVRRYNHLHGIEKTSIHLFRHTFARKYLENGGAVVDLQRLLDHADINTTMGYIRDYSIDVTKTIEVFNPQKQYGNTKHEKLSNKKRKMKW